jgi:hypothetical protein
VNAAANLATVRSNRRVLIFRASTHSWETRRLDLPGGPNSEPPPASPSPSPPRFSPDSPPGPDNPHSSPSSGS